MARFEIYVGKQVGGQVVISKYGEANTRREQVAMRRNAQSAGASTVLLYTDGVLSKVGVAA